MRQFMLAAVLWSAWVPVIAEDTGPFSIDFEQLAPGVWAGIRPDSPRFPVMGNTMFVIGDDGVVVFDGGGLPVMAEHVIDKIRSLTDLPVTHVVISHWHGDHFFGAYRFGEEYSDVRYVAHTFTRDVINSTRINYVDREGAFLDENMDEFVKIVETGIDSNGEEQSELTRRVYQRMIDDAPVVKAELARARVTPPDIVFDDLYVIESGSRRIELRFLGHANTAGDIVMWLPDEKIVATGDMVVLPSPYAFNVPPRAWSATLRALNELDYRQLVPGHGPVQTDATYVDLLIESSDDIAEQTDALLAAGRSPEEAQTELDFSGFEDRFTDGDEYIKAHFDSWFQEPFRAAALKALSGEPMVAIEAPMAAPFTDERWQISAAEYELTEHLGQPSLRMKGGTAMLNEVDLKNGILEFDIAVSGERGFAGAVFRAQDDANFENFYIRPHQTGNPDANQYQPVFNGVAAWQLYHGDGYGAPVDYRFGEWMPVKIVFAGSQARIYVDSDEPVLEVTELKRAVGRGGIGFSVGNFADAYFTNVRYTPLADRYTFPPAATPESMAGRVDAWQVSEPFPRDALDGVTELDPSAMEQHTWTVLTAEPSGLVNLARAGGVSSDGDTVFARVSIKAHEPATRVLFFGYSDAARVFVNGRLVYSGDNTYLSRDYRYLGTIGLFDSVVLPLEAGDNEISIAVTENFGGWGLMAVMDDPR